jgi:chemotaxis protein methyltransferase CheR
VSGAGDPPEQVVVMDLDRAVDVALLEAERAGIGRGARAPGWMRARARSALAALAERRGSHPCALAASLRSDAEALEELARALRVGETRFYRDRRSWSFLERSVLPDLRPSRSLSVLSAGCSTGEEAYTAAMLLSVTGRRGSVLGVDNDRESLESARVGRYPSDVARDLPDAWARRFLRADETAGGAIVIVAPPIAERVEFERIDVCHRAPPGSFDLILFKNVLVYLSAEAAAQAISQLARALSPSGLLWVAASEMPTCRAHAELNAVRLGSGVTAFTRR